MRFTGSKRLIRRAAVVLTAILATLVSLVIVPESANAQPTATLALSKGAFQSGTNTPLTTPVTPGGSYDYQLSAACSGLTQGCIAATTVDVLPPDVVFNGYEPSPHYTVAYNAATRTVTVTYTDPLPAPPNPPDSIGVPAGSTRVATLHVSLSPNTTAPDGSKITNTADSTAENTAPSSDSADITVSIPRRVTPVASKSFSDNSLIAQSGATTTVTLGVQNSSSASADVTSLTVADVSKNTWDDFDLTSLGPLAQLPAGADQVSVGVCTDPAPCTAAQFVDGAPVPGPDLTVPNGIDPATVTGIRFTFSNSNGTVLPVSTTGGVVPIGLTLRNTVRSTGAQLNPTSPLSQQNCASPSAVDSVAGPVTGTDYCARFTVLPGNPAVGVSKQVFPDASGNYTNNGYPVAGQSSPVTALSTVRNDSAFPVTSLTITDPSATATSNFIDDVDVASVRLVFPTGATAASGTVSCADGSSVPIAATATGNLPVACPGSRVSGVTVTYTGTIPSGATAQLGLHGPLNANVTGGSTARDCTDGTVTAAGLPPASAADCANLTVQSPRTTVTGVKSTSSPATGGALVPGYPMTFKLQATNSGNLPQTSFVITDPPDPTAAPNPFDVVRLTSATVSGPSGATFAIELFVGGTWVAYNPAVLTSARGVRAVLTSGAVAPTQTVSLSLVTQVRDDVLAGTTMKNCQQTLVSSVAGDGHSPAVCAATLTVAAPRTSGQVTKVISPPTVPATIPGLTPTTHVRLAAQNTGNVPMNEIVVTDPDPSQGDPGAFFDAVDFTGFDGVNFPPGANRVQVDACTTVGGCAAGGYVLGTPSTTPALPGGVTAADVTGLRFTFTNSSGGYVLNPGANFPSAGNCPNATACFTVTPRTTLRSTGATVPVPTSLSDIATAAGSSPQSNGPVSFGSAPAPLDITAGTPQLTAQKTSDQPSAVPPGDAITYTLRTANTGTAAVPALTVTEPLPAGLVFDSTFAGDNGLPYTMTATVPAGQPAPPQPTFTPITDPTTHQVTQLQWQFPESSPFYPTSVVTFTFKAHLLPGTAGGTAVSNTYGATTADTNVLPRLTCAQGSPTPDLGCTASTTVKAGSGDAVDAQKWVHGDDSRGFYNTKTNEFVPIGDPGCPLLTVGSDNYTRFPCIALVLAGQNFNYVLNITNVGTTPLTRTRLVDDLPKLGDEGIVAPGARGTEWDPRPTLAGDPTLAAGAPGALTVAYSDTSPGCTLDIQQQPSACPPGAWDPTRTSATETFRAYLDFATPLAPAQSTQLVVPMSAPANLDTTTNQLPIAWNSFAHTDFFGQPGAERQLRAVEPEKVGVAMPFGNLQIDKVVTGDVPPGSIIGPFRVDYSCAVTTAGGENVNVAKGSAEFSEAAPFTVKHVPAGAECTVEETDTGGGNVSLPPLPVTITPDVDPAVPAPSIAQITNDFPAPRLIVTKAVEGAAAGLVSGPFVIRVDCQIRGDEVDGYPRDLTFDRAGSQSITDLPIGSTCTATEPDDHGATSTSTEYSDVNGHGDHATISALVDGVAALTNTYDAASLTVSKKVAGPGSAGPYTFTTTCTLTSNLGTSVPVTLAAADAKFSLSNGQSRTIAVPKGASCLVTEMGLPHGDTVTYDGHRTATPVTVAGDTTLDVVNTFPPAHPPTTPPTTPPTSPPTSPAAPVSPAASPPSTSGGGLAFTGVYVLGPLAGGLLLVAGGLALWLLGRRRRSEH